MTGATDPTGLLPCGCRVRLVVSAVQPRAEIDWCRKHAAAPDLLDALRPLERRLRYCWRKSVAPFEEDEASGVDAVQVELDLAAAAIEKAAPVPSQSSGPGKEVR